MKHAILVIAIGAASLTGCKSNDASEQTAEVKKKAYHCERAEKLGSMITKTRCVTQADKELEEQKSKEAFRDARAKAPRIYGGG
ncbi:hypothetical protein [Pseudoalteromonas sp. S16_S37]|uniref:hypothetical protein n=1 Tax=Pseudoalteromonas sp. S16_S37 TaxID=2720228 RepID=UPI00168077B6|nr:hypothetical protein [Pseudoalteromonas sp. S16_S37]MBD1584903.1 hypothetical protein [Pseudoalteromonas sp. S16_S37]